MDAYEFDTLGEYLPTSLPDGYHFGKANLYETTMKDGTRYYMLRVQYITGNDTAQGNAEEEIAADPNTLDKSFVVFVMNYEPKVDWTKVTVDTKILVRDYEEENWTKRHFAKYENGKIYAYDDGKSSFTTDIIVSWSYGKLYKEE